MATKTSKSRKKDEATKEDIIADHAATGRPVSPTEDPTSHAVPAGEIARMVDPRGAGNQPSGAVANADSIDKIAEADKKAEKARAEAEENTLAGKIRKSGLFFINDHSRGGGPYVGISPSVDPNADFASKTRSLVEPLDMHSPRTGLQVILEDGTAFVLGDEFGMQSTPADWAKVMKPDGKPLFA